MNTVPFAIIISFSMTTLVGKVGPFENDKDAHDWCAEFRKSARERDADITALTSEQLNYVSGDTKDREFLPSRDPDEIINHAHIRALVA